MIDKEAVIVEKLSSRKWRMCSGMYKVINEDGISSPFVPRAEQMELLNGMHYLNIIPKARQLGMSTFVAILILDHVLWNTDMSAGIIDISLSDAKFKLGKIKYAYNSLDEKYKSLAPDIDTDNKEEIRFSNGSSVRVGTSHRGGTLNILHVSEFDPIQKSFPEKAKEIVTGALNAVGVGNFVFIESTATGNDGYFQQYCMNAKRKKDSGVILSKMDYKLFFFPWMKYRMEAPDDYVVDAKLEKYFQSLLIKGITLDRDQKYWYEKKYETQQEDMRQEYPSYLEEAFEVSTDGKYYVDAIAKAYEKNMVCEFEIEPHIEVDTYWDLGKNDFTAIHFVQTIGKERRVIDYLEGTGEHISFYCAELKKRGYIYGKCWLPHDAKHDLLGSEKTIQSQVEDSGFDTEIVQSVPVIVGIQEARKTIPQVWWKKSTTKKSLERLGKYTKKWVKATQSWGDPYHDPDGNSDCADSYRYFAVSEMPEKKTIDKDSFVHKVHRQRTRATGGLPRAKRY